MTFTFTVLFSIILLQIVACPVPTIFKWKMQLFWKKRINDILQSLEVPEDAISCTLIRCTIRSLFTFSKEYTPIHVISYRTVTLLH